MLNRLRKIISVDNPIRLLWHKLRAFCACAWNGFPARNMVCIGITGTNGKTTTTHMIEHILRTAGRKTAMISTVEFRLNGKIIPNLTKKTTLSPFKTQRFLKQSLAEKIEYAVIESSSHALHQHRLWGIPFAIAVLTNITHEHLDYHQTMEKYRDAKKILFHYVRKTFHLFSKKTESIPYKKAMILNTADRYFEDFNHLNGPDKITYGFDKGMVQAHHITYSKFGSKFALKYGPDSVGIELKIPGSFNIENALAATGAALACKVSMEDIKRALETFEGVPGRMEFIPSPKGFEVLVDFALTPDALIKLYKTLRESNYHRIIGIIGSCGDRDREKRPVMGRIVAENSALTIVTDEEPYTEDPKVIMEAVLKGAKEIKNLGTDLFLIEDRYQAIEFAIQKAEPGDLVVVTGMGSFDTRTMNKGPIPWDERKVVREIIEKYS